MDNWEMFEGEVKLRITDHESVPARLFLNKTTGEIKIFATRAVERRGSETIINALIEQEKSNE